ncbi:MAG: HEAT repeat domain-containing protein, partial [Phycisphaerae bacterium]|nr:HEAT repeat domain-containing protein [Phycisphaerae bacterium]
MLINAIAPLGAASLLAFQPAPASQAAPAATPAATPVAAPVATPAASPPAPSPGAPAVPSTPPTPTYAIKPLDGFKWDLFAKEPLVEDPVAFAIDEHDNIFVAESFRQEKGIEDNRSSAFWLNDDLQLQSVEDRIKMYEKWASKREGGMDYYRREVDRVVKLLDTDGDGVPDAKVDFSGPMNQPEDGTGAGVLALDGSVYYTCIPHLWRFQDTKGTGVADVREKMFSGFGIRTALRGHDMHGLVQGPDGRIYWSIGDRGYRVTTKEGKEIARTFTGAVFRCEPDGSGLEVFAHSLRNPQELAFNQWGDLFTGDNNSDAGDRARIVYIMEGGETGWDMNYQTLEGQNQRGPWSQEHTWWKWDANDPVRPAWTLPPLEHLTDGPSGMAFYPGLGLPERYDNHFFLCDFLGGDEYSRIVSFAVEPDGAGYKVVDAHPFVTEVLATDVDFGYDGRMYISDWSNGWYSDHTGQIFRVWSPEGVDDSRVHELGLLMRTGFKGQTEAMLFSMLAHPDIRLRQRAHIELANRPTALPRLKQVATDAGSPDRERLHALWALGIVARRGGGAPSLAPDTIVSLLADTSVEVRRLAARLAGDARIAAAGPGLIELLSDEDGRVKAQAAISLGKIEHQDAFANLSAVIWENDNQDPFIRHAAVLGLIGTGTADKIHELAADQFPQNRLAAVLAMRRMNDPQLARLLHDPDLRVATEAARAINDLPIAEGEPALAALAAKFMPNEEALAAADGTAPAVWTRELWTEQKDFPLEQLATGTLFATPPTKSATSEEAVGFTKAGNNY